MSPSNASLTSTGEDLIWQSQHGSFCRRKWVDAFENNVFWFLPPAFCHYLITIAVALTQLIYVCISQLRTMLGLSVSSDSTAHFCAVGFMFLTSENSGKL